VPRRVAVAVAVARDISRAVFVIHNVARVRASRVARRAPRASLARAPARWFARARARPRVRARRAPRVVVVCRRARRRLSRKIVSIRMG